MHEDIRAQAANETEGTALLFADEKEGEGILAGRVARLFEKKIPSEEILILAPEEKFLEALRAEISRLLPRGGSLPRAETFFSFAIALLQKHGEAVGAPADIATLSREEVLLYGRQVLATDPFLRAHYGRAARYIFVAGFHAATDAEITTIDLLGAFHRNIFVFGTAPSPAFDTFKSRHLNTREFLLLAARYKETPAAVKIEASWKEALREEFKKPYFTELAAFVRGEYLAGKVYPPPKYVFRAFELCPYDTARVVILGQDPYHGAGQAHGLCFSVPEKVSMPPSLQNIYKEIKDDIGGASPQNGNLERWAKQGVLLLNATLTVRAGTPGSHQHKGWEQFTDAVIKKLSDDKERLVFLLWGKYAQEKGVVIDTEKHLVLSAAHPSPYSAANGFFGCKHFSATNNYLQAHDEKPIVW